MLPAEDVIRLNQYAQGVRPMSEASSWFASLEAGQRQDVLRVLAALIQQAHPRPTEIPEAIRKAGLKPTHTPSVLLGKGPFTAQAAKVWGLPEEEQPRSFSLFVALLGIADGRRRRTECADGCSHWWHQDPSR